MSAPVIEFCPGINIFDSNADILVNAVNRVGVMGGGIAKAFKDAYPQMYQDYRYFCETKMNLHEDWYLHTWQGDERGPVIANLPTKDHWKEDSNLGLIRGGMKELVCLADATAKRIRKASLTVAVPKLGCGLGNLEWATVRPAIVDEIVGATGRGPHEVHWLLLGEES